MVKLLKKAQQGRFFFLGPIDFCVFWFVLFFFSFCQTLIISVCDKKKSMEKKASRALHATGLVG
jgi:hypothetical protein